MRFVVPVYHITRSALKNSNMIVMDDKSMIRESRFCEFCSENHV
jgi:hypothetical protein